MCDFSKRNRWYVRVSSADQSTARQLDGVDVDELFENKAFGKDTNRPQLQAGGTSASVTCSWYIAWTGSRAR